MIAQILTPWMVNDRKEYQPLINEVLDKYKSWSWSDVTGQPAENLTPDPNLLVIELTCDKETLAAIEADDRFLVLWSEDV